MKKQELEKEIKVTSFRTCDEGGNTNDSGHVGTTKAGIGYGNRQRSPHDADAAEGEGISPAGEATKKDKQQKD